MNNQASKITKFSDIKVGMVVKPINGNRERGGIISRVDESDKSFMFAAQWGWEFELGRTLEVVDTRFELPMEIPEKVAAISVYDDTTHLMPADYMSMIDIALMTGDKNWFAELTHRGRCEASLQQNN